MKLKPTREKHGSDPKFFKDEICEFPICNEQGYGFARGVILCRPHYDRAIEIMKSEGEI